VVLRANRPKEHGGIIVTRTLSSARTTGGATDVVARLVAERMSEDLGQQVFIENRPGAGTMIGASAVARSPADGYTIR
jgi:tripartite-type tricarboxylate transporter receptor subunit TctC